MSEEIALDAVGQRYRLKGELGRGGMSVVYEGLDPCIGRQVVIRLLHPHLAAWEDV
jgi:serine/threonine-protein kinase